MRNEPNRRRVYCTVYMSKNSFLLSFVFSFLAYSQKKNGYISIFCILHINIISLVCLRDEHTRAQRCTGISIAPFSLYSFGIGIALYIHEENRTAIFSLKKSRSASEDMVYNRKYSRMRYIQVIYNMICIPPLPQIMGKYVCEQIPSHIC